MTVSPLLWVAIPVFGACLYGAIRWLLKVPPYNPRTDWRKRQ